MNDFALLEALHNVRQEIHALRTELVSVREDVTDLRVAVARLEERGADAPPRRALARDGAVAISGAGLATLVNLVIGLLGGSK